NKGSANRTNMIGGGEIDAISVHMDKRAIHETNSLFWDTRGNDILGATALPFYGAFISEEKCQLLGDLSGKKLLEIGCGSGQSLHYAREREAAELWGVDLSENQIEKTRQ